MKIIKILGKGNGIFETSTIFSHFFMPKQKNSQSGGLKSLFLHISYLGFGLYMPAKRNSTLGFGLGKVFSPKHQNAG